MSVAGCERAPAPVAPDPLPLRLGLPEQPSSAMVMVALARRLFAEQGLDVTVTRYRSGKLALRDGLLPGKVDLITAADAVVAKAGLDGDPAHILGTIFEADNLNRIVARKDAGITSGEDLAGKTVATQQASAVHFFWHLYSLDHGIHDPEALRFMAAEDLPQALASGTIDAFAMREPYVSEARGLLGENALILSAPGLYRQRELLLARTAVAHKRPAALRRFVRALLAAEDFCAADPAAARALVARELSVPVAQIATLWPAIRVRLRLDQSLLVLLEDQARWYMSAGLAPQQRLPNYLVMVDPGPLLDVAPTSVALIH